MQYSSQFLSRKIVFIAACMSVSACLQIFAEHFIYWSTHLLDEFWRLWTGHWVHVGWIHYLLNMIAFACLPFIFPHAKVWHFVALLLVLPPAISLSFYYFLADIDAYAGLSGCCMVLMWRWHVCICFIKKNVALPHWSCCLFYLN